MSNIINQFKELIKHQGIKGSINTILRRLFNPRAKSSKILKQFLAGKYGLEIGGPSNIFKYIGILPIYPIAYRIDNCNFSYSTIWEGSIEEGYNFHYSKKKPPGFQHVCDSVDLGKIKSNNYDFILSCHTLEHIANPLKALYEWKRVLKDDGFFVLILPHKDATFDHLRPITKLSHLIEDYDNNIKEDDLTHLLETLKLHELNMTPEYTDYDEFKSIMENNKKHRRLHHHVFDTQLVIKIMNYIGFKLYAIEPILHNNIIAIGRKTESGIVPDNTVFLNNLTVYKRESPFKSDRN